MIDDNDPKFGDLLTVSEDMEPDEQDVALAIENASRMLLGLIGSGLSRNERVDLVVAMYATVEHSMTPEMKVRAGVLMEKLRDRLAESDERTGRTRERQH